MKTGYTLFLLSVLLVVSLSKANGKGKGGKNGKGKMNSNSSSVEDTPVKCVTVMFDDDGSCVCFDDPLNC